MAERLLIRLDSREVGHYQWLKLGDSASSGGTLEQLAQEAIDHDAVLLLPAAMVLLVEVDLPVKNAAQLRQALPFALEDKLADEVENYHLVWVRQTNQRLAVAAVDKLAFAACIEPLRQTGIHLSSVYPESLCLPYQAGECSLLIAEDQAWFRHGPWQGGAIDVMALPLLLTSLQSEGWACQALTVYGKSELSGWAQQQNWAYTERPFDDVLGLLAGQLPEIAGLNLLTAEYAARPAAKGQSAKRWLPAGALLVLALALQLVWELRLGWQLQDQVQQLDQQTQALFQTTFPDIKRIVNVKVQADQRLQELQKQHQAGNSEFLRLLYASGEQLMQQPGLQLRGLNFADNRLQLRLLAGDDTQVEQFKQTLQSTWAVNAQSLEKSAQGVEAQIDVQQR
jgi:general secretion pathway protein L